MKTLSQKLRKARTYVGMTQLEVASHLCLTRQDISRIECGRRKVSDSELKKLASLYRRPLTDFTGQPIALPEIPFPQSLLQAVSALPKSDRREVLEFAEFLGKQVYA